MRVAVSSAGEDLDAMVDPRFGRCAYFVFVDLDTMKFEGIPNPSVGSMGGAGIQAAQIVSSKGANVVITGNIGPNAYQTLSAAGIKITTGASGTVRNAIEMYKSGKLTETTGSTVGSHFGMGMGMGRGMGRGGGWGQGRNREKN